jgi:Tol biopolymer transport system component
MRTYLLSIIILCILSFLPACQPKPALPIPNIFTTSRPKPLLPIPQGRILFALRSAPHSLSNTNIYTINTDGTDAKRLTNDLYDKFDPSWSPDGTQIVYISDDENGTKLYKMNADGSQPISLTNNLATISMGNNIIAGIGNANPDWSPDGQKIIFTVYGHIKELNLTSGKVSDVLTNTPQALFPKWSSDGTKIMFVSGDGGQVFIMNADGTDKKQITQSLYFPRLLDWSPDGLWVAVVEEVNKGPLSIMRPDGSERRILTDKCMPLSAAFSPDSQWLVMTCEEIKGPGIYIMNVDEGILRNILDDTTSSGFSGVDWSP